MPMITDTRATPMINLKVITGEASARAVGISLVDEVWAAASNFLLFRFDGVEMTDPMSLDLISAASFTSDGVSSLPCCIYSNIAGVKFSFRRQGSNIRTNWNSWKIWTKRVVSFISQQTNLKALLSGAEWETKCSSADTFDEKCCSSWQM